MEHQPLTKHQAKILIQACEWIEQNQEACQGRLDMSCYAEDQIGFSLSPYKVHECETNCCFLGHFPLAGIEAKKQENWGDYADRIFQTEIFESSFLWKWLFSGNWDNDIGDCLKRAAYTLQYGVPKIFEHSERENFFDTIKDGISLDWKAYGKQYNLN